MKNWSLNAVRAAALLKAPQPATPASAPSPASPNEPDRTALVEAAAFKEFTDKLVSVCGVRPADVAFIGAEILDRVTWDQADQPSEDVPTLVQKLREAYPYSFSSVRIEPEPMPEPRNLTERVAMEARAAQASTSTNAPNPWSAAGWSVTMQVAMEHRDPERAARMKAEAGK